MAGTGADRRTGLAPIADLHCVNTGRKALLPSRVDRENYFNTDASREMEKIELPCDISKLIIREIRCIVGRTNFRRQGRLFDSEARRQRFMVYFSRHEAGKRFPALRQAASIVTSKDIPAAGAGQ